MSGTTDRPILADMRRQLNAIGASEMELVSNNETLQVMFDRLQELREEMNQAKLEAAQAAAEPYLQLIRRIEKDYAMILKLSQTSYGDQ